MATIVTETDGLVLKPTANPTETSTDAQTQSDVPTSPQNTQKSGSSMPSPASPVTQSSEIQANKGNDLPMLSEPGQHPRRHSTVLLVPARSEQTFPSKLRLMLDKSEQQYLGWTSGGLSFYFRPSSALEKLLLSTFRTNKISSFVRQLNGYGFMKKNPKRSRKGESTYAEFIHPNFRRDRPDLLLLIDRKGPYSSTRHVIAAPPPLSTHLPGAPINCDILFPGNNLRQWVLPQSHPNPMVVKPLSAIVEAPSQVDRRELSPASTAGNRSSEEVLLALEELYTAHRNAFLELKNKLLSPEKQEAAGSTA